METIGQDIPFEIPNLVRTEENRSICHSGATSDTEGSLFPKWDAEPGYVRKNFKEAHENESRNPDLLPD